MGPCTAAEAAPALQAGGYLPVITTWWCSHRTVGEGYLKVVLVESAHISGPATEAVLFWLKMSRPNKATETSAICSIT